MPSVTRAASAFSSSPKDGRGEEGRGGGGDANPNSGLFAPRDGGTSDVDGTGRLGGSVGGRLSGRRGTEGTAEAPVRGGVTAVVEVVSVLRRDVVRVMIPSLGGAG